MNLTRRNTIVGLGVLAGGAGVIGGTGAFDAVEAQRTFEVGVAGDADALLGLTAENDAITETDEGGAGDNPVIGFVLQDGAVNEDAVTEFFTVFTVTNNGSRDGVRVSIDTDGVDGVTFPVPEQPARIPDGLEVTNGSVGGDDLNDGVTLDVGESIVVDLRIDTTADGGYVDPEGATLTITAQSTDAQ